MDVDSSKHKNKFLVEICSVRVITMENVTQEINYNVNLLEGVRATSQPYIWPRSFCLISHMHPDPVRNFIIPWDLPKGPEMLHRDTAKKNSFKGGNCGFLLY